MSTGWQVRVIAERDETDAIEALLASLNSPDDPPGMSSFEIPGDPRWQVDAYFSDRVDEDEFARLLGDYDYEITLAPQIYWVAQSLTHHQQITAGRFHIYGSHHKKPSSGGVNIKVNAGMAFGTGQHNTTLGCLLAIDQIAKERPIINALDMGCGTGILALALASVARESVTASDIDPIAVDVARQNATDNRQAGRIRFVVAPGMQHRSLATRAPYDVIVANILAKPLCQMSTDISNAVALGGIVVLSGLLNTQEQAVLRTYRNRGLAIRKRFIIGEWSTLILQRLT
jgi:ribosomal protein L11 methyltransferase